MGVDVRRGGDIAVTQPFLDLFHGRPLFQQQAGAGVTKLVEATNGHSLVEAENAICYDIVRGYGLRRSLFGRKGGISSWHEKAENISIQKCLDLLLPMQ